MFKLDPLLKKRVNAFTIDLCLVIGINYFIMASFTDFLKIVFFHFPIDTQIHLIQKFKYINSVSQLSIMFGYFTAFYYATNGQTMGKMLMNLKVRPQGEEMTLTESMKRSISYIACAMFFSFPFLLSFFREDQKSVADIFSKTSVEVTEEKVVVHETEFQLTLLDSIQEEDYPEEKAS